MQGFFGYTQKINKGKANVVEKSLPSSLTRRFSFDFLAELGTNTVVVGADIVQAPSCQLVSIVELENKRTTLIFCGVNIWLVEQF